MDSTAYTLLLAMGAAVCAAFISGWLLHMMVSAGIFWTVMLVNLVSSPVGLFCPWYCPRQREWAVVPTSNIFVAALLSILVSSGILLLDRAVIHEVPANRIVTDQFVRTLIAVCGIAMATSLVFFLLHYSTVQEAAEIRRAGRKIRRMLWKAPKAKLMLCDDLAAVAPGECAICLEELSSLEAELACAPADPSKVKAIHGLLRFPCGHTFHGSCADRWMAQEVSCPMCRQPIGNLTKCTRYCLRPEAACALAAAKAEEGRQPAETPSEAEVVEGAGGQKAGAANEARGEVEGVLLAVAVEPAEAAQGDEGAARGGAPAAPGGAGCSSHSSTSSATSSAGATCKATVGSAPSAPGPGEGLAGLAAMASVNPTRQPRAPRADLDKEMVATPEREHQKVSI